MLSPASAGTGGIEGGEVLLTRMGIDEAWME